MALKGLNCKDATKKVTMFWTRKEGSDTKEGNLGKVNVLEFFRKAHPAVL